MGNAALIQELLLAGAHPDLRDPACGLTVMHDAAREGFIDSVSVLVEHGADANLVDGKGNLPLHLAAREGHLEVVRLLIGRTANPRALNWDGHTAQQLAHRHGRLETAEYMDEYTNSREYSLVSLFLNEIAVFVVFFLYTSQSLTYLHRNCIDRSSFKVGKLA